MEARLSVFDPGPKLATSSSLLREAFELHEMGHIVASAMLGRVALESFIYALFEAYEVQPRNSKTGIRLRGRILRLREEGILGRAETAIVFRSAQIGNDAAHCRSVEADDVRFSLCNLAEVLEGGDQ